MTCSATSFSSARRSASRARSSDFVGAARTRAGDGAVLDVAAVDADEQLGRGADDVARGGFRRCFAFLPCFFAEASPVLEPEAQEVHVGRRIDDAQRAVDLEGVDAGGAVEALREHALEDVAGGDVLLGRFDRAEEVFACGARGELERLGDGLRAWVWAARLRARRFSRRSRRRDGAA